MNKKFARVIEVSFAIVAFGIGCANIVNGVLMMNDIYHDVDPIITVVNTDEINGMDGAEE